MMAAVVAKGITYQLARTWDGVPRYYKPTLHRLSDTWTTTPPDGAMRFSRLIRSAKPCHDRPGHHSLRRRGNLARSKRAGKDRRPEAVWGRGRQRGKRGPAARGGDVRPLHLLVRQVGRNQ